MPANAASQPRIRSSSVAWPTDSWIWSAICSLPRIRSVASSDGHGSAREQGPGLLGDRGPRCRAGPARGRAPSRGCRTGRGCPGSSAAGSRRSPTAVAFIAAPHSTMCWSTLRALARDEPLAGVPDPVAGLGDVGAVRRRIVRVTPSRRSPFSARLTDHGSSRHSLSQWPGHRRLRGEAEVLAGDEGRRAGDRRRLLAGSAGGGAADVGDGEEAPARSRSARGRRRRPAPRGRAPRRRRCGRPSPRCGSP